MLNLVRLLLADTKITAELCRRHGFIAPSCGKVMFMLAGQPASVDRFAKKRYSPSFV